MNDELRAEIAEIVEKEVQKQTAELKDELAEEREARRRAEERADRRQRQINALTAHVRKLNNRADTNYGYAGAAHTQIQALKDEDEDKDRTADTDPDSPPISLWVSLPEHLAQDRLSPNEQRARRFFKNVSEYTSRTPGGRAIRAGELKRVLIASQPDERTARIDSKTVERVMRVVRIATRDVAEINQQARHGERTLFIPDRWAEKARERARSEADSDTPESSGTAAT